MGQPVQIEAEDIGVQPCQRLGHVKALVTQHAVGQVVDAHVVIVAFQVGGNAGEAHRVHFELDRRGDHVGQGALKQRFLAEVIDGRSVHEDEIGVKKTSKHKSITLISTTIPPNVPRS
jgi:hypothetical protein